MNIGMIKAIIINRIFFITPVFIVKTIGKGN